MMWGSKIIFAKLSYIMSQIFSVYPKASITQLSYYLYTLVRLDFHSSILNGQFFFCNWITVMDNLYTCVINQSQFTDSEVETADWSKSCESVFEWSKTFESVFIVSSPLPFLLGKKDSQKLLLGGITIFFAQRGRLHFGGRSSAKEYQVIKVLKLRL